MTTADPTTSPRYALFLRAINTGGRRVRNEELVEILAELDVAEVAAHQAAGNLTFRAGSGGLADEQAIADHLTDRLGYDCPVFVRSWEELRAIPGRSPFSASERAATEGRVHVTFLATPASGAAEREVAAIVPDEDLVVVDGREWWWLPRAGISTSALRVGAIERLLGPMTTRTLGTIERFAARFPN